MRLISVIGGNGFIGTRLVRRLQSNERVSVEIIDKRIGALKTQRTKIADVRSIEALSHAVSDETIIVNLAAEHHDDVRPSSLYDEVNVGGARNICQIAREKNTKTIIFLSTVAVYGFAPINTSEAGLISPFNDYGRTKHEAELIFKAWQAEEVNERALVIIRPTVVFGEQNRGNVYNLLRQIASKNFVMVGNGQNRKSMAYVENVAAFIEYCLDFQPGIHIFNYTDKPDFKMNELVLLVKKVLGRPLKIRPRIPFVAGYIAGKIVDVVALISGAQFPISSIRVKKFCANSVYSTAIDSTGFERPVPIETAIERTVRYEFLDKHEIGAESLEE